MCEGGVYRRERRGDNHQQQLTLDPGLVKLEKNRFLGFNVGRLATIIAI